MISRILPALMLVSICSCGPTSDTGAVKVFDTRREFEQALRDGSVKQGDKVAVREGNLDDVPGLKQAR